MDKPPHHATEYLYLPGIHVQIHTGTVQTAKSAAPYWAEDFRNVCHINYKMYCFSVRKSMFRQHPIVRGQTQARVLDLEDENRSIFALSFNISLCNPWS